MSKQPDPASDGPLLTYMTPRDTALVLAGLRALQRQLPLDGCFHSSIVEILADGDAEDATVEEIDRLCERINR